MQTENGISPGEQITCASLTVWNSNSSGREGSALNRMDLQRATLSERSDTEDDML